MSATFSQTANATRATLDANSLVGLVRERKAHSERTFLAYYNKLARWYDRYRGIYSGKFAAFRNNIHIPFIYSVIQSDVARKIQMSLGNWPLISFEGYPPEQEPTARKNEILVSVQWEDLHMYLKAVDFLTTLDLYGVAIMRWGWKRDLRQQRVREPLPVAPGLTFERTVQRWQTYFDGPDGYVVDPLDFFPQPGFRHPDDMAWAVERYWRDLDDMRAQVRAEQAAGTPREELSFDPRALEDLALTGSESDAGSRLIERISVYRNATDFQIRKGEKYAKPVEVWDHWGTVPDELLPADGERMRRLVVLNGRVLAKNVGNPYWHGQKPWTTCAIGDPHYFHGVGKSELLEKLQAASNRLLNHKLDSLDLSISPVFLANSSIVQAQNLVTQPGRIISIDGPVGEDVIRPLLIDRTGIQQVGPEVELLWRYMQQGSGIVEDTVQGGASSRQTAHEFQGRQEAVMTRLMSESRQLEEGWLEPSANLCRALNRQFLTVPKQINMLGSLARTNPITGAPLPPDTLAIDHHDLWPDYRARAVGANQTMMRAATQQNVIQLLQAASANPALMQLINWTNFARQLLETFGFRNINEMLNETAQQQQLTDATQGAARAGVPIQQQMQALWPQQGFAGGGDGASGSPETLDPAHMMAMMAASGARQPMLPLTR